MSLQLWFDVGIKRYTTHFIMQHVNILLWFDVGIKRYTTAKLLINFETSCGLM